MTTLPPLPVALPLAVGALLLLVGRYLPWRIPDAIATVMALVVLAIDVAMTIAARSAPLVYWFGGWQPRGSSVLGIGFVVGQADGTIAALIALLFAASFVFAWGYFEAIRAFFHVLMLLFLAAMQGFCLTHDLFDLFVWFEVMSVAAFALTAYRLEASSLEGALNFTVTNSIASFLMLGGIGLLYLHAGALDFGALAASVAAAPRDPVIVGAFCALATALMIKAATVPFQAWLADAHAVAPSPVSVIFSGTMVPLGVFGIAKLYWEIFAPSSLVATAMHTLVLGMGAASAVIGGVACLMQRHFKRLLAFSTISHVGVLLIGTSSLSPLGLGGMLAYLVGHGLVKGALFMLAGMLLATLGGIDELGLCGRGTAEKPTGIVMAIAGLILGGAPVGLLDQGARLIDAAAPRVDAWWCAAAMIVGTACTGAAVLRATARIFLGWGKTPGEEARAPSEQEAEDANRPLWLMMIPVAVLLGLALVAGTRSARLFAVGAAARFIAWDGGASLGRLGAVPPVASAAPHFAAASWVTLGLALLLAAFNLSRARLPRPLLAASEAMARPVFATLESLHDGLVGNYVTWIIVGLALFTVTFFACAAAA